MNDIPKQDGKRPVPWMILALVALACVIAWRMASVSSGAGAEHAATGPALQVGMVVAPTHEGYACSTPELAGQAAVFEIIGAKDKLRGLLDQGVCVPVSPQQRFKVVALKEKLVQVVEVGASSMAPLWMPARDLAPLPPEA